MTFAGFRSPLMYPTEEQPCHAATSPVTDKQKRKAEHIEKGYEEKGVSRKESEERAWRTVNKQDKGGKQSGSGRKGAVRKKVGKK